LTIPSGQFEKQKEKNNQNEKNKKNRKIESKKIPFGISPGQFES
jgi:hypothetical protein